MKAMDGYVLRDEGIVWALRVAKFEHWVFEGGQVPEGCVMVVPEDRDHEPFYVSADLVKGHNPRPGDYYISAKSEHRYFMPQEVFEGRYRAADLPE